ncbi:hypothetical protein MD537_21780, partial [Flavihumibacter sediminis]|nr:hypothetical protein [Flavihumibacter sediminis]
EIAKPAPRYPQNETSSTVQEGPREKVFVNGINVSVLVSREMYFDNQGKPITTSLKDHTKKIIQEQFASLDEFLRKWNNMEKKEALIEELQNQGVLVEALYDAVGREVDL